MHASAAEGGLFRRLTYRVVGLPPERNASREQRLRWIRKFYRFNVGAVAMVVIFALLTGTRFLWLLAAAGAMWWAWGVTSISVSIRREQARAK